MLQGSWLPGYYLIAAGVIEVFGDATMPHLKLLNVLFALGTTGAIYLLAKPRGFQVAFLAALLFALNPLDIVISSYATPEALTLFSVFLGVALIERRPLGDRRSLYLASAALLVASTLRYEAWGFILLYLVWKWFGRGVSTRSFVTAAVPALVFMVGWVLWTSQFGFLPQTILAQISTDVLFKESAGTLVPGAERYAGFFLWYLSWTPFAVLALIWAVAKERRAAFSAILLAFYGATAGLVLLNLGNPSPRYVHLSIPIVCLYGASALVWLRRLALPTTSRKQWTAAASPILTAVLVSLILMVVVLNPTPLPGTFNRPMERAGLYVSGLPHPEGKMLVAESPIAAYFSGYPASEVIWSTELPSDREEAEAFLVEHVAYVVMVTVPYYRLRTLFPEQADGANTGHLRLLYDASGPEYDLGAHRVLVFEVIE